VNTDRITGGAEQPRDPECFEEWLSLKLQEQPERQDEIGRVARWVLERTKPGHPLRWIPEPILLARNGHAYDVPAHYERHLRYVADQPEESVETFFRVFDIYLKNESVAYDRMVEEIGRKLDGNFGGGGNGDDGHTTTGGAEPERFRKMDDSWEGWNRFFYELKGPEELGYELDEDGYPVERIWRRCRGKLAGYAGVEASARPPPLTAYVHVRGFTLRLLAAIVRVLLHMIQYPWASWYEHIGLTQGGRTRDEPQRSKD
jgi:hypothetical protein